jgi:hypothetical protein
LQFTGGAGGAPPSASATTFTAPKPTIATAASGGRSGGGSSGGSSSGGGGGGVAVKRQITERMYAAKEQLGEATSLVLSDLAEVRFITCCSGISVCAVAH